MSETQPSSAPSTAAVISQGMFINIPGEVGASMLHFYTIFYRNVDQVRQYYLFEKKKDLASMLPMDVKSIEDRREQALAIAEIVKKRMSPFDKSPALRRYEDVTKVIAQHRGRCGEWANVFTAFCVAAGLNARVIFDSTDHVWTEVKIDNDTWLPIDTTLANVEVVPYARALSGKPITWILAFGPSHVEDVTFKYVPPEQVAEVTKRRDAFSPMPEILIETFNMGAESA